MTVAEAAALGVWLPILTRALLKVLGATTEDASWNIIQANGKLLESNSLQVLTFLQDRKQVKRFHILIFISYRALEVHAMRVT